MGVNSFEYFGFCLEGFFFGLYSGIFAMYLHYHASQNNTDKGNNILFYALCVLYALSMAAIIIIVWDYCINLNMIAQYPISIAAAAIFGCNDFISQSILIYRCWIVWGQNIGVVIIPSVLAFAFLAIWITGGATSSLYNVKGQVFGPDWEITLLKTAIILSMAVNVLVTGLIVFKILKVYLQVKTTVDGKNSGVTHGSTFRRVIFMLVESGMALFFIQLARLVTSTGIAPTEAAAKASMVIDYIHPMINGIAPTLILVRVSMGLSFHDENSMVEAIDSGSLHFAHIDQSAMPEDGSIGIVSQERRGEEDDIGIQSSDDSDIQMAER